MLPRARRRSLRSAALFVASASAISACATVRGGGDLEPRYVAIHNALAAMGLAQVGPLHQGSLAEGREVRVPFELAAQCTTIVALGAPGVRDIDATLLDPSGKPVAHDTTVEPQAVVRACVDDAGSYTLVLKMKSGAGDWLAASWTGGVGGGAGSAGGGAVAGALGVGLPGAGTCESPIALTAGTITGSTAHGQSENEPGASDCSNGASSKELVYRFEVPQKQRAVVEVAPRYDSVVYLRKDDCADADAEIACNDDAPHSHGSPSPSRLDEILDPGTYYLFVDGYREEAGAFRMTFSLTDVPSLADVCRAARPLAARSPVSGATSGSYDHAHSQACGENGKGADTAYRLDLAQRQRVRIVEHSDDFGPVVHLRRQCTDEQTEVACADSGAADGDATFLGALDPGAYTVFADATDHDADGRYTLVADTAPLQGGGVSGDACGDAIELGRSEPSVTGDTFQAHDDLAGRCGGVGSADVVYRFELARRSRVTAHTKSAEAKHVFVVQKTCGDRSTELACGDTVDQVLAPGAYFLVLDGDGPAGPGKFDFAFAAKDVGGQEAACRAAPTLPEGRPVTGTTANAGDKFEASCARAGAGAGATASAGDRVYRLAVAQKTKVRLTLTTPGWSGALTLRGACAESGAGSGAGAPAAHGVELACNAADDTHHAKIEQALDPGTYWVTVDGTGAGNEGAYTLEYRALPALPVTRAARTTPAPPP